MALRDHYVRTRSRDRALRSALPRLVAAGSDDGVDPILLGRVLLLVTLALVTTTVPLLDHAADAWAQVAEVCVPLLGVVAVSFRVPWNRLSSRAPLVFPILVCGGLLVLSAAEAAVYAPLAGLLSLSFAYIGLTQPPKTSFAMLPLAAVAFVYLNGQWSAAIAIRLFIASFVWVMLGELLARFAARQRTLSTALRIAAHTDALTGLANRRDLELHLAGAADGDMVVLCDLDHFKRLNDTRGHHVGDQVLADFGSMLRATLRGGDYCARFGGEEFVLVLPTTSGPEAEATLSRLRTHWAVLHPDVTFSAGLAAFSSSRAHEATLAAADSALYVAKASGRDCNVVESDLRPVAELDGGVHA